MHGFHGLDNRGTEPPRGRFAETGRFGRMFPYLRTLYEFEPGPETLGRVGGPMDGGNPGPEDATQNNPRIKAGYTFLGQFIDHDVTFDPTSILERQIDPQATHNFRTPALELDSLYGRGPKAQPFIYDQADRNRFLVEEDGFDLPRNAQGTALIGDPRNDENILVSQLHLLFLKFHNRVYDGLPESLGRDGRFEEAQRLVRWHYQWIVMHEFLPRLVGKEVAAATLMELPFQFGDVPFMPIEFSIAAYRFGHSQVRPGYALGEGRGAGLFPDQPNAPSGNFDLRGGRRVPAALRVEWDQFFGPDAQPSKLIDPRISTVLLRLPFSVVDRDPNEPDDGVDDRPKIRSLATRNLQRGIDARLPSGQSVAAHLAIPELNHLELWQGVEGGRGPAPLWFYILREAEARTAGRMLAGVGAAIVARVFSALLAADKASFLVQDPHWQPSLGPVAGQFTVSDLVNVTLGNDALQQEDLDALEDGSDARDSQGVAAE